ncbi:MAG: LuxR C-terminal-related transcriptional regulator [Candidatus Nanopelagicales bacterium]
MTWEHSGDHMASRSALLKLIANDPTGDALVEALARGAMSIYQPFASAIYAPTPDRSALTRRGSFGYTPSTRYESVPMNWDYPITRAFLTGEAVVVKAVEAEDRFPLMAGWAKYIGQPEDLASEVTVLGLPLVYAGTAVGACTVVCTYPDPWSWFDYAFMEGVCAAMALWQRIDDLKNSIPVEMSVHARSRPLGLSERQQRVLQLMAEGKSNSSIARSLGFSLSTVKAEVQIILEILESKSRTEAVTRATRVGLLGNESTTGNAIRMSAVKSSQL